MDADRRDRFEEVFRAHYAAVRAYALRRAERTAAEDAVAETFLVAWRRLEDLPVDALPWLLAVARRMLGNQRRGQTRRERLVERLRASTRGWVPPAGEPGAGHEALRALAQLRPADREVLMLVAWDDLTGQQAAELLGCSPAASAQRLHRARQRFAAALEVERSEDESACLSAAPVSQRGVRCPPTR